jgi:hypothetical protein
MIPLILCDPPHCQTLRFAAEELTHYLTRMLWPAPCPPVQLRAVEIENDQPDQFSVHMTAQGGSIVGVNARSVLLGVYDYLRRMGCRFLGPGRACEVVPSIAPDALSAWYEKQAAFRHRGVCIEGANALENVLDWIDWLPKIGCNSFFLQFQTPYPFLARWYRHEGNPHLTPEPYTTEDAARDLDTLERAVKQRGLLLHQAGHGWTGEVLGYETVSWQTDRRPLSPDKQPMAAELGGVRALYRDTPANTNLCFHSGQAVETFVELVVAYAKAHPATDYLHIWLADEPNNVCECADCRQTTPSDQYVALLNAIDRRLTAEGLDTRLVFLLYQELLWPPIQARLANPDRFVLMFAPISRTFERSYQVDADLPDLPPYRRNQITLPTSLSENLAFLRGWQCQFQGDSFVYDYPLGRAHYGDFGYLHIARVISSDIKQLRQLGLNGYLSCQELRASLPNALPNYVMGYTLFDPTADPEALIDEYFSAAYGEGAVQVRPYLESLSRLSSCDYLNGKSPRTDPQMADRMAQIVHLTQTFAPPQTEGLYWQLLDYHRAYVHQLAHATEALARGQQEESRTRWLALRQQIGEQEQTYQPYLDVYRLLEVTSKYTGFPQA